MWVVAVDLEGAVNRCKFWSNIRHDLERIVRWLETRVFHSLWQVQQVQEVSSIVVLDIFKVFVMSGIEIYELYLEYNS